MDRLFDKIGKAALLVSVFVILAGCNYGSQSIFTAAAKEPAQRAAWIAYWDLDAGKRDLSRLGHKVDKVSYFGAYFDKEDRLFIPAELGDKKIQDRKQEGQEIYLTLVNDKQNADGSVILKDMEILHRLFSNDKTMERHIAEIIALTLQGGYDGLEIDYERVWKDGETGRSFSRFVDKLYAEALKNNLKVRIVLEPSVPFAVASLPQGPEYVVMVYNLYGLHSGPGPKADREFIQKTLTRMKALPGEKSVALSTGGCLWGDNGKKNFLTEAEARSLALSHAVKPKRDEASQCLVFSYQDGGISYEVWYADVETLNYWIDIVKEHGINNISLWRLGGNMDINRIKAI
ncbi:putative membrane protein [Propionispora sp. 2/2-37]|uniref:glycosyl hydrolase family 18 protein n=1 Tax=Propionispora sp. 2/2-37 TaxID=1677858 RepID=UPI0006BB7EF5|nr:glycosyl hydrolase family 18 protein [Propionispora sp. 2/2-37]CUH97630.1 putative membrane protein [Propionispora sp. 2/2-37]